MRYMILGAGPGMPHPDYNLSSLIVQTAEANFLVDCGEGVSKSLLRHGFNGDFIDAVIISHYHPDHVAGLFMLLQMFYLEKRTKPLNLFLPERPAAIVDILHLFYTFEQRFSFALKIHEVKDLELYYDNVVPALNDHLTTYAEFLEAQHYTNPMQSYCVSFSDRGKVLLYTADLSTFANLHQVMMQAHHIIIDALHPDAELIKSLKDYPAERIILTHGISDSLAEWLQDSQDERFVIAGEYIAYLL